MTHAATLEITTPSDRELVIVRDFAAPRRMVFDCMTRPELVRRWLLGPEGWTIPVCEIDLRVGGTFRYVWRHGDGREMGMGGVYREIVPSERIVHNELFDEDWTGGETQVTQSLTEHGGRTRLTTAILYASKEAREGARTSGMADGMEAGYARLDAILAE